MNDRDGRDEPRSVRRADRESDGRETDGIDRDRVGGRDSSGDRSTVDLDADPERPDPDRGDGPSPSGPAGPDTHNWSGLSAALAVLSFLTAGAILVAYDAIAAVGGAALLGVGFGAISVGGRTITPAIPQALDDAWAEHRRYVWFSTGLFALGAIVGVLLYAAGVNLMDLFLELITEEFGEGELPEDGLAGGSIELSASFFIANNTPPFLAAIFGALTVGLVTALIMVFNGVLIGNVLLAAGAETGFGTIIALLVPHGVFELPALFIAAGVGFRFLHRTAQRIAGSRDALLTRAYLRRTTALVVFGWLLLVLAAFVEAYVTILVADALASQPLIADITTPIEYGLKPDNTTINSAAISVVGPVFINANLLCNAYDRRGNRPYRVASRRR